MAQMPWRGLLTLRLPLPQGRVRDIKYDYGTDRVAALGTEGCIKLFDMERDFRITRTVRRLRLLAAVAMVAPRQSGSKKRAPASSGYTTLPIFSKCPLFMLSQP